LRTQTAQGWTGGKHSPSAELRGADARSAKKAMVMGALRAAGRPAGQAEGGACDLLRYEALWAELHGVRARRFHLGIGSH
jgi:hypothetical protein